MSCFATVSGVRHCAGRRRSIQHTSNFFGSVLPYRVNACTRSSSTQANHQSRNNSNRRRNVAVVVTAVASLAGFSIYTRHVRSKKLATLTPATDSGLLISSSTPGQTSKDSSPKYDVSSLIELITRAGLVGSTKSVKDELDALRKWHTERGYNGGLVVRDLSRPLFSLDLFNSDPGKQESASGKISVSSPDIGVMNQRECYYLYYEILSNGETRQQLFCRGTTVFSDVLTCLQTWFVYDEELGCRVHYGFNEHANRIVEDVIPLLVPPSRHSTVEVCGHSLGGAVSMLVAIKLRKRGYFISRVTSVAGPRFCRGLKERDVLEKWLPADTIRIEDDLDLVTYLPPFGVSVGDKLWLVSDCCDGHKKDDVYMLPREWMEDKLGKSDWVESVWLNLRLFESLRQQNTTHRVSSYAKKLKRIQHDHDPNDR
ncbi:hypothetical protein HJC23_010230 [Cyclotella cryptica]|uniref:Fungal lipase-type domain-containing protein n=1 Tax=Cyclotella cryptica TaxID=29204 RepID=A0ABD3PZQ0_9STRA|eukprot:CCRYP_009823-RA/>CCRYP_009823-RA protein AED:0.08 eAED:-0.07 QI:0/-1/0/1/-1/1/1/0/426